MTVAAGEEVVGVGHVFVTHVEPDFGFLRRISKGVRGLVVEKSREGHRK